MATYKVTYSYTLTDSDGHFSTMTVSGGPTGDTNMISDLATNSLGLVASLANVTNAKLTRRGVHVDIDNAQGIGTFAEYPDIEQRTSMIYGNNQGSKAVLHIPAPKVAIFKAAPLADVVDGANTAVTAFNTAVEALARDQGAVALNLFLGGGLESRRRARRISLRTA